jgi:hypothetical protein
MFEWQRESFALCWDCTARQLQSVQHPSAAKSNLLVSVSWVFSALSSRILKFSSGKFSDSIHSKRARKIARNDPSD